MDEKKQYIKIIIIASSSGIPLVSIKVDQEWDENLVAPFLTALHGFSNEKLGALDETLVQSGKFDMYVRRKHNLMLITIMDKKMKKIEIGKQADQTLDSFYSRYKTEIDEFDESCTDIHIFKEFEGMLKKQMEDYYSKIENGDGAGFWARLRSLFENKKPEIR